MVHAPLLPPELLNGLYVERPGSVGERSVVLLYGDHWGVRGVERGRVDEGLSGGGGAGDRNGRGAARLRQEQWIRKAKLRVASST